MSESETRPSNVARDALGIAVFALAAFASISVAMSIWRPVQGPARGAARAVELGAETLGVAPLLTFTLGLTLLGGGVWLFSRTASFARDLAGLTGLALGLSVLLGAATADAGGLVGDATGAKVSAFLSSMVGVPFGLACVLLPAWLAWGRSAAANSAILGQDPAGPAVAPASEVEGVSPAEAEALLPRIPPRLVPPAPPPSPYPPDVRLQGRIPDGTQPIYLDDDARPQAPADPDLAAALLGEPPEGPEAAAKPAGEDLARADAAVPAVQGVARLSRAERRAGAELAEEHASPAQARGELSGRTGLREGARPITDADLPRPPWEQPVLFEEPVDAYGTPLSILRSHRGDGARPSVVDPPDLPSSAEIPLAERVEAEPLSAAAEDLGSGEQDLDFEEQPTEDHGLAGELDEDEELTDELEEEDLEGELEDEELVDELEEDEEEADDEETGEEASLEDLEGDERRSGELARAEERALLDELGSDGVPAPNARADSAAAEARRPVKAAWDEDAIDEPAPAADALETEPLVELTPRAAPSSDAGPAAVSEELVRRAGALFLERQRVAVSLLQREFQLDFEQSTAVLDQLQAQGLIGPYMGGQRREILMTAEEWERHCAAI
jgi:hypothetical protein